MNIKSAKQITILSTGGVINISLAETAGVYPLNPTSNPQTQSGSLTIAPDPSTPPVQGMEVNFLFTGSLILAGNGFSLFGYQVTPTQAKNTWSATCYYNGSVWEVFFTQNNNTTPFLNGADIITNSIYPNRLTYAYTGSLLIGDNESPSVYQPRQLSGDITMNYLGQITVNPNTLTLNKIQHVAAANMLMGDSLGNVVAQPMTGNVVMNSAGQTTIQPGVIQLNMLGFQISTVLNAQITLSSAQILALNASPLPVVAAIGGKTIIVVRSVVNYTFVTTAYTTNKTLQLTTNTATVSQASTTVNMLGASVSQNVIMAVPGQTAGLTDTQLLQNQPLMVQVASGNPAAGDGTAVVSVWYVLE